MLSALFLAWGDGFTGLVRNFIYGKRNKGIWGNAAMFAVCMTLAYFMNGRVGYVAFRLGDFNDAAASVVALQQDLTLRSIPQEKRQRKAKRLGITGSTETGNDTSELAIGHNIRSVSSRDHVHPAA